MKRLFLNSIAVVPFLVAAGTAAQADVMAELPPEIAAAYEGVD
jgi:hypothetical protein